MPAEARPVTDARACSAVLKVRRGACGTLSEVLELDAAAPVLRCRCRLPQNGREDGKPAATSLVRRDRIPATLEVSGRQPHQCTN
jgi:hypothetical protein